MVNKQQTAFDAANKGLDNAALAVTDKARSVKDLEAQLKKAQTDLNQATKKSQGDAAARAKLDKQQSDLRNSINSESQTLTKLQQQTDALDNEITQSNQGNS